MQLARLIYYKATKYTKNTMAIVVEISVRLSEILHDANVEESTIIKLVWLWPVGCNAESYSTNTENYTLLRLHRVGCNVELY